METMNSQSLFQDLIAGQGIGRSVPSRSVRPCQLHGHRLQLFFRVLTQKESPCPMLGAIFLCQTMTNLGGLSFYMRSYHRQTSQTADPQMVIPRHKTKDTDKLQFEEWPARDTIQGLEGIIPTRGDHGSTHPRQATDWLAEIDQAKSMQDLDDVGSVFGSTRMRSETLRFQSGNGLMKIINLDLNKKSAGGRRIFRNKETPGVERKTDRFYDLCFL